MSAIREIKIWSRDDDALITVKGAPTPTPGLFVNEDPKVHGRWNITHLSSGCAVAAGLESPEQALDVAIKLAPVADWTLSPQAMLAEVPRIRERVLALRYEAGEHGLSIAASRDRIARMEPLS